MISIEVKLENDFDTQFKDIEITREELKQFACNKAKGMYMDSFWQYITAFDTIKINSEL